MLFRFKSFAWLVLVVSLGSQTSCAQSSETPLDLPFEGQLLFVEDLSGHDGLHAGRFGDLVILDGTRNLRREVTRTRYYYASPSFFPDGRRVAFESKRPSRPGGILQLNNPSQLYVLDLETGEEELLDEQLRAVYPEHVRDRNHRPSVSPSGRSIAFMTPWEIPDRASFQWGRIVAAHLDGSSVSHLDVTEIAFYTSIDNVRWSPDETLISFNYNPVVEIDGRAAPLFVPRAVAIFSVEQNAYVWYPEGLHREDSATQCSAGGWAETGRRFVFACRTINREPTRLFLYDVDTSELEVLAEIEGQHVFAPQFSERQRKVLYIGSDGNLVNDIWMYDLTTGTRTQLTHDGRHRRWMAWRDTTEGNVSEAP